jgi:hypothetical protein
MSRAWIARRRIRCRADQVITYCAACGARIRRREDV